MMKLRDILKGIEFDASDKALALNIDKVTCDSRLVEKGSLFIAFRGYDSDGAKFIQSAIANGAAAVVTEKKVKPFSGAEHIVVRDTRSAVPVIAGNFYEHPSYRLKMIGITGTNGKTSITYILESILKKAGICPGVIGTVNYRFRDTVLTAKNTTPGPLELQSVLNDMVNDGVECTVMEVSSHSLDQNRVEGISFDAAIFTNVTQDHLDYHKTIKSYFCAKAKLLGKIKEKGTAILNDDDAMIRTLKKEFKGHILTYGLNGGADIRAENVTLSLDGSSFTAVTPKNRFDVKTSLIGRHNVSNILAAIASAYLLKISVDDIAAGIGSVEPPPGRLEPVVEGQPFKVFVDFAHTEDALNNVLGLLRGSGVTGRIIVVFGCGGNRDRAKRPLMGKAACKFSDMAIITSDNPRFEEPMDIIKEIESGVKGLFSNYAVVADRREAIETALNEAGEGDIVMIAGKGHEKYQIIKDKVMPFDDCKVARDILRKRKNESKGDSRSGSRKACIG
ncbi:MAG: UDP-N-acetylmuramoyl-L-alanyl-D-glutamate--2,6-diaminopimelate ligase [Candidatus Omnitrophota bacterium]|jgi:UDP-N-acetylmuramoyl-L-alanyl-D-glutamate--2,6-diaminopimelate ligase